VQSFSSKYEWQLLGISMDSQKFTELPSLEKAHKMVQKFNVKYVPAVVMLDPKTEEMKPVGWGLITQNQLEENILQQCRE